MYKVDYLDLVTIRSCQMACEGCCTFSDHREINGLVEPDEESLAFWGKRIMPGRLHLFGGEPTMHPRLMDWFRLAGKYWPVCEDGDATPIWLNTNGYYLDKLFPHVEELFTQPIKMFVSITHHTLAEPYNSLVQSNYEELAERILEVNHRVYPNRRFHWKTDTPWDSEHKKFVHLTDDRGYSSVLLNVCRQHDDHFVPHYKGHGATLEPWYDYNDDQGLHMNHNVCHIKNYVQIYQGRLYKCPPRGVLNQTLETYNLQDTEKWAQYYNDYESLGIDASSKQIDAWFERQRSAEKSCNMCGFMHSHYHLPVQEHLPKKLFKIKPVQA